MGWHSIWRRSAERPINALGWVTVTVRFPEGEAKTFAQFLDYWDWETRPEQTAEFAAMRRAGARIKHKLRSLGFVPPPLRAGLWRGEAMQQFRSQTSPPP